MRLRICAALVALVAISYASGVSAELVYDDVVLVRDNAQLRSFEALPRLFDQHLWQGTGFPSKLYRPLLPATLMVEHAVHGGSPRGYRLTNIALHAAVTVALFLLLAAFGHAPVPAGLAAALFAAHPVHTEAVDLVINRSELLATLCFLAGLGALQRDVVLSWRPVRGFALAALAFAVGLLCRESMATFPAIAALLLALRAPARPRLALAAGFAALAVVLAGYLALRHGALATSSVLQLGHAVEAAALSDRLSAIVTPLVTYLRLLFVPLELQVLHEDVVLARGVWLWAAALLPPALSAASLAGAGRRAPSLALAAPFFYLTLLPSTRIFADPQLVAERFLYLPSVALALLAAPAFEALAARSARLAWAAAGALALSGLALTADRNLDWRSEEALWRAELEVAPSAAARFNLGAVRLAAGAYAEAEPLLHAAVTADHATDKALLALAQARYGLGRPVLALQPLEALLARRPGHAEAAALRARILDGLRLTPEAFEALRRRVSRAD